MDRWLGKTALVTGAASGIGKAITHALLRNGVNVTAVDIQEEKLAALLSEVSTLNTSGRLCTMYCDLSKAEDIDKVFAHIEKTYGGVDIMVNNAGIINHSRVIESDRKIFERMLNINVLATATCINKAVRSMRDRNVEGHVFNINSVVSHMIPKESFTKIDGYNGWNLYTASKHATFALNHTVRLELAALGSPIRVTSISPGLVNTDIYTKLLNIDESINRMPTIAADDIADALIYALGTRPEVQITQLTIQHTSENV